MKKLIWLAIAVASLVAIGVYEWRYSADMQGHIDDVNRDLDYASVRANLSTGLLGSLQSMRDETDVGREILETHEYVHTLKDEMLARRVRKAAEDGVTVGGAIQNELSRWSSSVEHPEWD